MLHVVLTSCIFICIKICYINYVSAKNFYLISKVAENIFIHLWFFSKSVKGRAFVGFLLDFLIEVNFNRLLIWFSNCRLVITSRQALKMCRNLNNKISIDFIFGHWLQRFNLQKNWTRFAHFMLTKSAKTPVCYKTVAV